MSALFEVKIEASYAKQTMHLVIPGGKIPKLLVDHKKLTPEELVDAANSYLVWAVTKFPELSGIVEVHAIHLKQRYYQQRRYLAQKPSYLKFGEHICQDFNSLNPGSTYCNSRNGMGGTEQIPDVIGEIIAWKAWPFDTTQGLLCSTQNQIRWFPCIPVEAVCSVNNKCPSPPCLNCGCGIYAANEPDTARSYGTILGKVKLWGRFLQGELGYRAQFAYPAEFHLNPEQGHLINVLKVYNVPIFAYAPTCVWRPE